jgi:hypothetical protein
MKLRECYHRLELSPDATITETRSAYKKLVKHWHPDRFEADSPMQAYAEERLKIINAAYDFLCKNQAFTKTSETIKRQKQPKSTFRAFANLYGIFWKTSFFKRQLSLFIKRIRIFLKEIIQSSNSHITFSNQTENIVGRKVQKSFKQYPNDLKKSTSRLHNVSKKIPNRFIPIHALRKSYGPRLKKGIGPISKVASLDKDQSVCSVPKVSPIRPIN